MSERYKSGKEVKCDTMAVNNMMWAPYDICFCANPKFPKRCLKCRRNYMLYKDDTHFPTVYSASYFGSLTEKGKCKFYLSFRG